MPAEQVPPQTAPTSAGTAPGSVPALPLAGVMGWPVAHSRSPQLHRHWLDRYGIRGHYVPLTVAPEHLAQVLHALPRAGFVGLNVTIPHKQAVLALADVVTDRAALIGAANTLIFRPDGRIHADNTDGYGFTANLFQQQPEWNPAAGPAAVIGAGGAARAVVAALAGREDAAREMLGELQSCSPQFVEAARRFGKAGLMPADVIERIVPVQA